ncbi:MAG TPA: TIGR04222 domain-containing membrane protein [Polyangia bacterium]|jgi:uncharacterized protein (TIGR04222 family)|nr:TIGR04222 domain-containing membrane protein [Polyangia bacterium]
MNPFDLHGPEFLLLYLLLFAALSGLLILFRRRLEVFPVPKVDMSEPYLIASLRGGQAEMLRVAMVSLVDRGYLVAEGPQIAVAPTPTGPAPEHPLERALLEECRRQGATDACMFLQTAELGLMDMEELKTLPKEHHTRLTELRLVPDRGVWWRRFYLALLGAAALVGVANAKLHVAAERGRSNTGILEFLRLAAPVACFVLVLRPRRTRTGDLVLEDLASLCGGLRDGAHELQPGTSSRELLLLAAVFGIGAVPATSYAFASTLFPRASSGNGSCGSGCGGGGCGGGCGGCGG